jgi:hypothetical protein
MFKQFLPKKLQIRSRPSCLSHIYKSNISIAATSFFGDIQVLTAANMKTAVVCVFALCSVIEVYRHFRGVYGLHHHYNHHQGDDYHQQRGRRTS